MLFNRVPTPLDPYLSTRPWLYPITMSMLPAGLACASACAVSLDVALPETRPLAIIAAVGGTSTSGRPLVGTFESLALSVDTTQAWPFNVDRRSAWPLLCGI